MPAETVQQRNIRMGWGCKCHGETFCPDEICLGYDGDVPVYVRRDSHEGQSALREKARTMFLPDDRVRHVSPNATDGGLGEGIVVDVTEGIVTVQYDRVDAKGQSTVGVYPPSWFRNATARLEKTEPTS